MSKRGLIVLTIVFAFGYAYFPVRDALAAVFLLSVMFAPLTIFIALMLHRRR
jgi:fructose-specific phosphotransferase system IIC component